MTDTMNPVQASEFAGLDADDLQSLRRKHTADYLKAREAAEDEPTDIGAWSLYQSWAGTLVEILVAAGDYQNVEDAGTALQALTFAQAAERFVELWASREGILWDLSDSAICAVADSVRDWVADGGELGQMPMRDWTAPYLAVTR